MKVQKDRYMIDDEDMDPDTLMALALSKYTIAKDHDEWMKDAELKDDPKIVALTSTVQKQEKELDKLTQILLQAQGWRTAQCHSNMYQVHAVEAQI